jgi:hypothetical protein
MPGTLTVWKAAVIQNRWFWRAVVVTLLGARSLSAGLETGHLHRALMCQPSASKGGAVLSAAPFAEPAKARPRKYLICSQSVRNRERFLPLAATVAVLGATHDRLLVARGIRPSCRRSASVPRCRRSLPLMTR